MNDRVFAWLIVYAALLVGWFSRILAERDLDPLPLLVAAIGGGALTAAVDHRLARKDRP